MSTFNTCLREKEELSTEKWHKSQSILLVYSFYDDRVLNQLGVISEIMVQKESPKFYFTIV